MSNQIEDNSVFEAVLETAKDLHQLGFIDQQRMYKYELICKEQLPVYTSKKVRNLRKKYQLSQTLFASLLNISPSTVKQWEQGSRNPKGATAKLLNILDNQGLKAFL